MTYAICFSLTPLSFTIVKQTSVSGKIFFAVFTIFATFYKTLADFARVLCFFSCFVRFYETERAPNCIYYNYLKYFTPDSKIFISCSP
mgnify:CR=1 FL=1